MNSSSLAVQRRGVNSDARRYRWTRKELRAMVEEHPALARLKRTGADGTARGVLNLVIDWVNEERRVGTPATWPGARGGGAYDPDLPHVWASKPQLTERYGCSVKTVGRAVALLADRDHTRHAQPGLEPSECWECQRRPNALVEVVDWNAHGQVACLVVLTFVGRKLAAARGAEQATRGGADDQAAGSECPGHRVKMSTPKRGEDGDQEGLLGGRAPRTRVRTELYDDEAHPILLEVRRYLTPLTEEDLDRLRRGDRFRKGSEDLVQLHPVFRERLLKIEARYPHCWEHSLAEASCSGGRDSRYFEAILERHSREGCGPDALRGGTLTPPTAYQNPYQAIKAAAHQEQERRYGKGNAYTQAVESPAVAATGRSSRSRSRGPVRAQET